MNRIPQLAALCAALAITPVLAGSTRDHCGDSTMAEGMKARVRNMSDQMDRIDLTTDRTKQRELLELHMKQMQEGLRELRKRELAPTCRIELMSSMMESMVRAQLVAHAEDR